MKGAQKLSAFLVILLASLYYIAPYFAFVLARTLGINFGFLLVYGIVFKLMNPGKHEFLHTVNMFFIVWLLNFLTVLIMGGFPGYETIPFAPVTVTTILTIIVVPIYRTVLNRS